mgnify:CR=1 FL=1
MLIKLKDDEILGFAPTIEVPRYEEGDYHSECYTILGDWTEGKVEIKIFFGSHEDYTYSKGNLEDLTSSNNGMSELIDFLLEDNDRFETLTASQFIEEFESHMDHVYNRL